MTEEIRRFELLAACYRSDLQRLDAIKEAAWYFSQLGVQDGGEDIEYYSIAEECDKETRRIRAKLPDLESLIAEMKEEWTLSQSESPSDSCSSSG